MACDNPDCGCDNAVAFMRGGKEFCGPYCLSARKGVGVDRCGCVHPGCPQEDALDVSAPKAAGA